MGKVTVKERSEEKKGKKKLEAKIRKKITIIYSEAKLDKEDSNKERSLIMVSPFFFGIMRKFVCVGEFFTCDA